MVEERPIISAECRLPLSAKTDPTLQRGLSAKAELLVIVIAQCCFAVLLR